MYIENVDVHAKTVAGPGMQGFNPQFSYGSISIMSGHHCRYRERSTTLDVLALICYRGLEPHMLCDDSN